ncbi:TPA: hypothetical protein JAN03_16455 [Citrobacter freundii]|nr:hypothetical protein [Citrobacter freundii]
MMMLSWSHIKPALVTLTLLTGIFLVAGLTLRFAAPALSLQQVLWQARYGLLAWRLCLYTVCIGTGVSLYRRLSPQSQSRLKRIAGWSLLLLVISEISNALQWGNGA